MKRLAALALAGLLAACGSSSDKKPAPQTGARPSPPATITPSARSTYKVGSTYTIKGVRHTPTERFRHVETGRASWYGPGFHGRKTANGEPFDQRAMTAAHRTLQLPSIIRVTNVGNGRQAVLRVNDRGPYHGNRVLDVSERAAEVLDFKRLGTAMVRIEVLEGPSRKVAALARDRRTIAELEAVRAAAEAGRGAGYAADPQLASIGRDVGSDGGPDGQAYVQAGAFRELANARRLGASLSRFGPYEVLPTFVNGQRVYRVRLGPYQGVQQAERALADISAAGGRGAHVVVIR